MCTALYEGSAKCDQNLESWHSDKLYYVSHSHSLPSMFSHSAACLLFVRFLLPTDLQTTSELQNEQNTCNFIDNIVYGTYDEQGEILLTSPTFDIRDWQNPAQYRKLRIPAIQVIGLALSLILVISLFAMAVYTKRALRRKDSLTTPWRPRRYKASEAPEITRSPSGITMVRSRSGNNSPPPLI